MKSLAKFCHELSKLKVWCEQKNYIILFDIFEWKGSGRWKGWKSVEPPADLQEDFRELLMIRHGKAPTHINSADNSGWGKLGVYFVKEGYRMVYKRKKKIIKTNRWNKIWSRDGFPR